MIEQWVGQILFNGKRNVLWGCGANGIKLLFTLSTYGVYIDSFCDSDIEKQKIRIFNKKIISPEDVLCHIEDFNIIVTTTKPQYRNEIVDVLCKIGHKECIFYENIGESLYDIDINYSYLYGVILDSYKKKILIYGETGSETRKLINILKLLDVEVRYIINDVDEEFVWENMEIKPIFHLMYEDKGEFKVVVTSEKRNNIDKLDDLGLLIRTDYNIISDYKNGMPEVHILDPNLGYNFIYDKSNLPGFVEFGDSECEYTICTLGGSTTDATVFPFKSWTQILYDVLKQKGLRVKILCGGCSGYKSSQELIKLARDVIPLKPNMIIHYTGINDAMQCIGDSRIDNHPFLHPYQAELFDKISNSVKYEYKTSYQMDQQYTLGVRSDLSGWDSLINNIKMMDCISKTFEIEYFPFLQPCLATKNHWSSDEKELIINTGISKEYIESIRRFYGNKEIDSGINICDMTDIFDNVNNVYMDICHVRECANEIIAQYIYDYIAARGRL